MTPTNPLIEFSTTITYFGKHCEVGVRYWPVTGAAQIKIDHPLHRYDWRWISKSWERKYFLTQPNIKNEIENLTKKS